MHIWALLGTLTILGTAPASQLVDLRALYDRGQTYIEFRDAAESRKSAWVDHYASADVADAVLTRLETVGGTWHLLVVAEDWCGDSANTIPYLAKLIDLVAGLEMRIIDSDAGRAIMEAHRTPDGRTATPTVLLLNERFEEVGSWVERPSALQNWFLAQETVLEERELYRQKYDWYATDAGQSTLEEIVGLIETVNGR